VQAGYPARVHVNGPFKKAEYTSPAIDFRIRYPAVFFNDIVKIRFINRVRHGDPGLNIAALLIKGQTRGVPAPVDQLFEHIDQIGWQRITLLDDESCYSAHGEPPAEIRSELKYEVENELKFWNFVNFYKTD
jgi:hypothetical protein